MRQLELDSVLRYFPFDKIREKQAKSCEFVVKALNAGVRDIMISAPTGVGKTGIGVAVCEWAASAEASEFEGYAGGYYLTVQKILQKQIERDFLDGKFNGIGASIKSSSEYPCPTSKNCGLGTRTKKRCDCGTCPYKQAKSKFKSSHTGITNYPFLFSEHKYVGKLEKRKVIVCDEAHSLERQLIRFNDLAIGEEHVKKWVQSSEVTLPKLRNLDDFACWVETVYTAECSEKLEVMMSLVGGKDDKFARECVDLEQHICKVKRAVALIRKNPDDWIYWTERDREQKLSCIARPLNAAPFTKELIHSMGTVRIYMSAFPGTKEIFCRSLGLDPHEVAWLNLNSPFDVKRRRVVVCGVGSMSKRNVDDSFPSFVRICGMIMEVHKGQKGIIHCNSYQLGQRIIGAFAGTQHADRLVFPTNADEREKAFEAHSASDSDSVIVSPSMTEGFDFANDLARWQIIAKVPYPSLGDAQVVAKKDLDEEWYSLQTIMTIVQASGRICRNEEDSGVTYIMDADFKRLFDQYGYMFPAWWADSIDWKSKV